MKIELYLKSFLVSVAAFFLPIVPLILLVGVFILGDTALGIWAAKKRGERISSRKLGNIIPKMVLYQAAVVTAFLLETFLLGEFISILFSIEIIFTKLVALTLIFIEGVSMDENFTSITGKNMFRAFKEMITRTADLKDEIKKLD